MPDVETFSGHIACDGESRSEIVVPVKLEGKVSTLVETAFELGEAYSPV